MIKRRWEVVQSTRCGDAEAGHRPKPELRRHLAGGPAWATSRSQTQALTATGRKAPFSRTVH